MSGKALYKAVIETLSPLFLETILKGLSTLRILSVFKTLRLLPVFGLSEISAEQTMTKSKIFQISLK